MAYNNRNYHRRVQFIVQIYRDAKERDVPDTRILQHVFPKQVFIYHIDNG